MSRRAARRKNDPCAYCHARDRAGELLCASCRAIANALIAGDREQYHVLVSGSGPWDAAPLPRPQVRFPGLPVSEQHVPADRQ